MTLCQNIFILLGAFFILSSFQFERTNAIRLCGRRLADLLNFICERHGGFHAPRLRRDAGTHTEPPHLMQHLDVVSALRLLVQQNISNKVTSKRTRIDVYKPLTRRSNSDSTDEDATGSSSEIGLSFGFQSGIVDECCKKQCMLPTLLSYCANVQQAGNIDLNEILPPESESFPSLSEEDMAAYQSQQAPSNYAAESSKDITGQPVHLPSHLSYSSRPNLGHSARNKPVFIVLPQLQEDDDRALGEYRF